MPNVVVLDYGTSNLRSVAKALEFIAGKEYRVRISDDPQEILAADRVVFPGQGAIGQCMASLQEKGLDTVIYQCIRNVPFLGICLGMQSLMDRSDEDGGVDCLGVIPGQVRRFDADATNEQGIPFKIPHMGWNHVYQKKPHNLWKGIDDGERFYFVHSYYVCPDNEQDIAARTDYSTDFVSAIARENVFACQFHPEKSQHAGLTLLKNFLSWDI